MKKELLVQRFVEQRDALETLIHERFHDLAQSKSVLRFVRCGKASD